MTWLRWSCWMNPCPALTGSVLTSCPSTFLRSLLDSRRTPETQTIMSFARRSLRVLIPLALLLAGSAWLLRRAAPPRFHGTTFDQVAPAADFALVDQHGRPVTRDSLRGAPALLFFGYTRCPDVCPLTLTRLLRARRDAGAGDVRVVLVTVDPGHDTPAVMREYVDRFGGPVLGLTGDSAAVARAMASYGAYTMPPGEHTAHAGRAPRTAMLGHSAVVYGLDRAGNLRVVLSEGAPEDHLRDDVRALSRL